MEDMSYEAFRNKVQKRGVKRKCKVNNSWGIYDAYKLMRKNKWKGIDRPLKEHEFYSIVREINNLIAKEAGEGKTVHFPWHMGKLELRKYEPSAYFSNGKLRIPYPIDWSSTIKLWFTDEEARNAKTLVRREDNVIYTVRYNKVEARYPNQTFYSFVVNNKIRLMLRDSIKAGKIETAYNIRSYD